MSQEGCFVWYDLMTTDLKGAMAFYQEVIGWTFKDSGMGPPGGYMLAHGGDLPVGGVTQFTQEACDAGQARTGWMGHIHVPDVDATAARVAELGGKVLRPAEDIPGVGRFAVVADPHGATFSLFANAQEYPMRPRLPMGSPGQCSWRELHAGDREEAWAFYSALFGWQADMAVPMGPIGVYQTFRDAETEAGGEAHGGMMTKMPENPIPHWLFYFNVDAADAAAARISKAGGQVLMAPMEVPGGGWIVVGLDPQGGPFATLSSQR